MNKIDVARLRRFLAYDPETGEIRWIISRGNDISPGDLAGGKKREGYRVIVLDGRAFKAHRIAWTLHYGEWPLQRLDHINRNPSDNRIVNLRQATHAQNIANTQSKKTGSQKGAYWHKQRQCWASNITIGRKKKHLGVFKTEAEAAAAFECASREIYGVFSRVEAKP